MHVCALAKVPSFAFCVLEFFGELSSLFDEWQACFKITLSCGCAQHECNLSVTS
jgi:hypothetical protein